MPKNSDELGFTSVFRNLLKSEQEEASRIDATEPHISPLIIPGDVERAFENGEFRVYYQPKVLATTAEIVGAEALLRWQHPEFGVLTPNYFIAGMEKSGLIREYGVNIAIDDFGVGFNSISHLARLPISAVKIDASLVGRLEHSEVDRK